MLYINPQGHFQYWTQELFSLKIQPLHPEPSLCIMGIQMYSSPETSSKSTILSRSHLNV